MAGQVRSATEEQGEQREERIHACKPQHVAFEAYPNQ